MLHYYIDFSNFSKIFIKRGGYMYMYFYKKKKIFLIKTFFFLYRGGSLFFIWKIKHISNILNFFFYSWKNFIFKKIKFKHKITWVLVYRKSFQIIKLTSNFANKIFFFNNKLCIKRKKNYFKYHSLLFWGLDYFFMTYYLKKFISLFFLNTYTLKGFKLGRMKYLKRVGKVSKYSLLKNKLL